MKSDLMSPLPRSGGLRRLWRTVIGLQSRATVLIVGSVIVMVCVLCSFAIDHSWRLSDGLEREAAMRTARLVAQLVAAPLRSGDDRRLALVLDGILDLPRVRSVSVAGVDAVVEASAIRAGAQREDDGGERLISTSMLGDPTPSVSNDDRGPYLEIAVPVTDAFMRERAKKGALTGYVRLRINRARHLSEFDALADVLIGLGIAAVLVSIPVVFMVVRRIVVPLNEMSQVARAFSAGDLSRRSHVDRTDEIGVLAASLNQMADEVSRKHDEVVRLNEDLERRVAARTAQLRELAVREPLTGLYNRRHFNEVLARRFSEAQRYGGDLSLMMVDLDDFKKVNDRYGHQTGDEVLLATARTISEELRAADVAARFGGDEFIILLPHSNSAQAQSLAERIVKRFNRERASSFAHVETALSMGIASLPGEETMTDDDFVREADRALYEAKSRGKNRIVQV